MKKVLASNHPDYGKFTLISFLLPVVGILLGVLYLAKDKAIDKKLGEHLVAISILFGILGWFVWIAVVGSSIE